MLSKRFNEALTFAADLHATQTRKGSGVPYIAHLLGVASIALEYGAQEDEAIAALLHDAIEDQGGIATREEIRRRFGDTVTAIVEGCTDAHTTPKPPWRERKEAYIAHLHHASPAVILVSAADKLHGGAVDPARLSSGGRTTKEPLQRRQIGHLVVLSFPGGNITQGEF
jgi:GTP pyrophosphokinase